jgi:hypothetical protein
MIFFFTTNAATWQWGTMYPHDFSGLMAAYIAGLPFLQNQLMGDFLFTTALFAAWELMSLWIPRVAANLKKA